MFQYIWPLALIVLSNVLYQICTKSSPQGMNPFASLTVTYGIGALTSLVLYFVLNRNTNLLGEYRQTNWAPVVLGIVIVGLEAGYLYAYRLGWSVSVLPIVQAALLAVILIFVGFLFYREAITWNKVIGILVCLLGLGLINMKQ